MIEFLTLLYWLPTAFFIFQLLLCRELVITTVRTTNSEISMSDNDIILVLFVLSFLWPVLVPLGYYLSRNDHE